MYELKKQTYMPTVSTVVGAVFERGDGVEEVKPLSSWSGLFLSPRSPPFIRILLQIHFSTATTPYVGSEFNNRVSDNEEREMILARPWG